MKELTEAANLASFRMRFEAVRSFDLEDDMEFCPGLLTESDVSSPPSSPLLLVSRPQTRFNWPAPRD